MWEQPGVNWRWKAKQILKVVVVILSLSWLWIVSKLVLQSSDFMHMLYACVHICGIFVCRHGTSRQEPTQRWNRLRLMMSLSWMTTALRLTSWCSANIVTSSNSMKRISSTRNSWFVFDYETDCRGVFRGRLSQLHPPLCRWQSNSTVRSLLRVVSLWILEITPTFRIYHWFLHSLQFVADQTMFWINRNKCIVSGRNCLRQNVLQFDWID